MKKITLLVSAFLTLAGAAQSQTIGPTTSPFLLQDNATFQFRAASGTNLNRWRLGQTIAGSSDGYFYLQHTTDGFVSNFFNAMACNTTGCAFGATTAAYAVDVTGQVNASTGFRSGGTAGLSVTKTVRASGGAADCTLIYTGGILTGGTC